jgi:N-acetylglutamate synthase-like GNAT family acetyltransferase
MIPDITLSAADFEMSEDKLRPTKPTEGILATELTTRNGFRFHVRPAEPQDETAVADLFAHLSPEDLRYRFLSPLKKVGPDILAMMAHVDHQRIENLLAFDSSNGRLIANAMLAAPVGTDTAEVALAAHRDYKHKGISWTLLQHVMQVARAKGIKKLQSIEDRGHKDAIALEREIGFVAKSYPGDATLTLLEVDLQATPALSSPPLSISPETASKPL